MEFIKKFINIVEGNGYTKFIDDPLTYKKVHVTQPPAHRMMINGQLFEQESPPVHTEVLIEYTGNGSIGNGSIGNDSIGNDSIGNDIIDDKKFAVIKFSIIQEKEPPQSFSQAFYDEDFDELIEWVKRL